ncbi:transcriptional regulator, AraC family with amidase-like domain [Actinacidiphila yanglinensis]|uniref:Transcriptional regulator, AraC family with amidase-like domain n=1 Tax=Actinacidiphila yanglinensis TaxID=310779 RepID=A0A1H6DAI7_9ACTN|nr:helix-turn-helix domain-containing protein [Actinacidiphila yanglinensis]SEG81853.1 transcriptional regulator, AraC family with amidase-like domain [Actinacidiphila yanglinensis]
MHRIAVVAVPPVTAFDLTIPELVFSAVEIGGAPAYDVVVCTAEPGVLVTTGSVRVVVDHGLDALRGADTVIVTGSGRRDGFGPDLLDALRRAAGSGRRIASICTGAFALASAGLLDGRPATTYWPYSEEFTRRFPRVDVRAGVLYTDDGDVFTSAGVAAGLDLCLYLVRLDHGAAVANRTARLAVVAPVRHGGQRQFIESPAPPEQGTALAETRAWALERLGDDLTLKDLAAHAHTSVRHLTRRFRAETGLSPLQWLLHQRVDRARELLESTTLPVEQVARRSGLGSSESLRQHFARRVGVSPTAYRNGFAHAVPPPS